MSKLGQLALVGALVFAGVPLFLSWIARGWLAKYDSKPYSFNDIPSQLDKVAVVTGGNTGIGKVTVRELARKGAKVILASRSVERGEAAKKDICSEIAPAACGVDVWTLDLSSLASVAAFAEKYNTEGPASLDMLILNAGVMACPYTETAEGVELQFGTNHLGHFFLVKQLLPVVEKSHGRVVTVSSNAHEWGYSGGIRFDQLTNSINYDMGLAYGQSKFANVLFSNELARRLRESNSGATANALHPGFIVSDLGRHLLEQFSRYGPLVGKFGELGQKWIYSGAMSADDGALTQLYVATAPELANVSGQYFQPIAKTASPMALAGDAALQQRLWEVSERLIEERYLSKRSA